jgi:hypothetical protein
MAERKKRPEIDIATPPQALIGLEPVQTLPETTAEAALNIPTIRTPFSGTSILVGVPAATRGHHR